MTRDYMIGYRRKLGLHTGEMAKLCGISEQLLKGVESGWVTHPNIVRRIKRGYRLTNAQAEALLPQNRRPHDPEYDPDRYVLPVDRVNPDVRYGWNSPRPAASVAYGKLLEV